MLGNSANAIAVKAVYDCLKHLRDGGRVDDPADRQASSDLLRAVNRTDKLIGLQEKYLRS